MSRRLEASKRSTPAASTVLSRSLLQRKCDCGNHTIGGAQCEECRKGSGGILQRAPANAPAAPASQDLSQVPTSANLTLDQKVAACEELLKGATIRRDELKILDILRSSTLEDRLEIARRIGRKKLISNFSLRRKKSVEVLTLDLDDFKALHSDTVKEYQERVLPQDKPYVDELVSLLKVSTPLDPAKAGPLKSVTAKGMGATLVAKLTAEGIDVTKVMETNLVVKGIAVTVLSDVIDPKLSLKGNTYIDVDPGQLQLDSSGNVIPPKVSVGIYTAYAPNITPKFSPAQYGAGTAGEEEGRTTLRYHEGAHGRHALEYLAAHPPPRFSAFHDPSSPDQGFALYEQAVQQYEDDLMKQGFLQLHCIGTKAHDCPP
ncbi:MAG TPA: hypothetical protein VF789_07455 [Thermoanaerobaculia bacterium]